MKQFLLVTHTEASHHVEQKVGGWYDSELTLKGLRDAQAIADRIEQFNLAEQNEDQTQGGIGLWSSDLKRASQTAQIIGEQLSLDVQFDQRLREMSFGDAEGQPQIWLDERMIPQGDDRLNHTIIPSSESRLALAKRTFAAFAEIENSDQPAIICTHGFAATFLIAYWIGMAIDQTGYVDFKIASGSITHLVEDDYFGNRSVKSMSDTLHLTRELFV